MNAAQPGPRPTETREQSSSRSFSSFPAVLHGGALLGILAYLGMTGVQILAILKWTGGRFVYSLDDPYIHLALATRIRSGFYGINAGEPASPSSSIIWPFLFVPFARSPLLEYLPLLLNLVLGVAAVWMITLCVRRSLGVFGENTDRRIRLLVVLLVLTLNLPGLTLTGLEHVLQLVLSLCCAYAMLYLLDDEVPPAWTLIATAILPCVRYEGLLLVAALAISLCGLRHFRKAFVLVAASIVVPVGFSLFLLHLHLPAFPLSVLLKSTADMRQTASLPGRLFEMVFYALRGALFNTERSPELILSLVLMYLAYSNRQHRATFACAIGGAFAAVLQTIAGPNGWFYRYEIAALAFMLFVAIAVSARTPPATGSSSIQTEEGQFKVPSAPYARPSGALLVALAGLTIIYMPPLGKSSLAALGIYEQQYQLGRLTHEFYTGPVAVNDIGLVSLRRLPTEYMLDLYGLASYEVSRVKKDDRTQKWLDAEVSKHGVGLVAVYPQWFEHGVPASWTPIGKLCSPYAGVSAYSSRVMIYDTHVADSTQIQRAVVQFAKTLPAGVTLELHPKNDYNTCPSS